MKTDKKSLTGYLLSEIKKREERGLEGQFSVSNAYTKRRRMEGLFFQLANWHLENKFIVVIIKSLLTQIYCTT